MCIHPTLLAFTKEFVEDDRLESSLDQIGIIIEPFIHGCRDLKRSNAPSF